MSESIQTQVLVVGGGPGGYVAAIRAGQLGLKTTLVEADVLGGTCLIRGCIPSKALIHAASQFETMRRHADEPHMGISLSAPPTFDLGGAVDWKNGIVGKLNSGVSSLLKKAKVQSIAGWARFIDAKTCEVTSDGDVRRITAEHVILANGSIPTELPGLPFGGDVLSSADALDLREVPRRVAVVGGGYIGLELGIALRKMGAEVTVIEATDRLLPLFDADLVKPVSTWLRSHGVTVHLNARAQGFEAGTLTYTVDEQPHTVDCDKVLVTVGRRPNTAGWGLDNMVLDLDGGFVKVDNRCHTSTRNVWAIGDLVGEPMLAHKASAQGEMVAEIIAGQRQTFEPRAIPAVCFTEPEIVGVGLSPDAAASQGMTTTIGTFPLMANGRALSMDAGDDGGFVRVTARKDNGLILGIHAVGSHVSELSGEFAHALEMGSVLDDIAGTIHVHPTLTEAFHEAALSALGHAIHI